MIINDYVTSKERLTFMQVSLNDFYLRECAGCSRNSHQITKDDNCTYEQLDWNSKTTNSGLWYCHEHCYRDSQ